jgi:hypothetical protein
VKTHARRRRPCLSKLKNQTDIQISTLQKIVEALGGELDVAARFPKGNVKLLQFTKPERSVKRVPSNLSEVRLF